jgi:hypothetical protein
MEIIAFLVVSLMAVFAFSGGPAAPTMGPRQFSGYESGRVLNRYHVYEPPSRKSVLVDSEGIAWPTADGTHMTKRDRSRLLTTAQVKDAPPTETPEYPLLSVDAHKPDVAPVVAPTYAESEQEQETDIPTQAQASAAQERAADERPLDDRSNYPF